MKNTFLNFKAIGPAMLFEFVLFSPAIGLCSVESTLSTVQMKLMTTILPVVAIIGIIWACISFAVGSPNARNHLIMACIGAAIGFGAPSIINFIRGMVQ